jgi:hypothetical protein
LVKEGAVMIRRLLLVLSLLFVFAGLAFAQGGPLDPAAPVDWNQVGATAIVALTPIAVFLLLLGARAIFPKMPKWSLPLLALVLGVVGNVVTQAAASPKNVIFGALLGLAATGVNELQKYARGA